MTTTHKPTEHTTDRHTTSSNIGIMLQLMRFVTPLGGFMALAVTLGVAGYLCAISISVLGVSALIQPTHWKVILCLLFLTAILRGILRYGEQLCNHYIAFRLLALLRDKIFAALRRLCPAKLEGRDKGDLIAMITSDIELLEVFYAHTISPILIAICTSLILIAIQGSIHPASALLAFFAYLTVGCVLPIANTKRGQESGRAYREGFGALSSHTLDNLKGMQEVIQFGAGKERLHEMNCRISQLGMLQKKMKHCEGTNKSITDCAILLFTAAQIVLACTLATKGGITAEDAVISAVLMMGSFGPVTALSSLSNNLLQTLASGQRVLNLLAEEPETEENTDGAAIVFDCAALENVCFAYKDEQILQDFSLHIPKGTLLGIQGKSGCGKSTVLKLLMRFWDVQKGAVRFSDKNIKDIATASLRQNQGYCTQETYLFHGTIAENIALGHPNAAQAQIEAAAQKAALHEFIVSLPDGYDTMIGQTDGGLSGGQRQRIGLARIFLADAPLMLLDEPTSNLDSLNESLILKALNEHKANKTIVLVSHRASTLRIADRIFQMEQHRYS